MIDQHAAIGASTGPRSFAAGASVKAWHFYLLLFLICVGFGLLSVALGPDNYWDLRYYHLYAPWAYLHDRYTYDIGPAQEQGFLNPTADFIFYGLISSPLNEMPRIVAFIMGALHGINAALLFAIACHVLRPLQSPERFVLTAAAWLMGVSGSGFVSLLGTTSNDLTSALFVLGSLLGVLLVAEPEDAHRPGRGTWPRFAAAGLWAGIGIGLKYTSAVYIPGLAVVALMAAIRRRTFMGLMAFGAGAFVGLAASAGHHMLVLWHDFGNPTFPYLNQIFHSPYWEIDAVRDARFLPKDLLHLFFYPFYWTWTDTYVVSEPALRDWRAAIAEVAMAVGMLALAVRCVRHGCRRSIFTPTPGLDLVFLFVIASYFAWVLGFAYYRYAIPLEMLTGVVTMGALIWVFEDRRIEIVAAVVLLAMAAGTTVYMDWGRGRYGDRYVDVQVPPLPPDAVVLIATWDPVAFFIPYAQPRAQYVGIENNYLEISQTNKLATEVKQIMRTPGRPKFVLGVDAFNADKLNALLARFGLHLGTQPCRPIRTNLEGHALSLCPVADG
jgi:hypothetical protein